MKYKYKRYTDIRQTEMRQTDMIYKKNTLDRDLYIVYRQNRQILTGLHMYTDRYEINRQEK